MGSILIRFNHEIKRYEKRTPQKPGISHPLYHFPWYPLWRVCIISSTFKWGKKGSKKIQELAQGHPILCGIQNQVCQALILLWLLLLNLLEHFSKNKLAPKKSESISFSDGLTPSKRVFPPDNILPSLVHLDVLKVKAFQWCFYSVCPETNKSLHMLYKRNHFNINSPLIWGLRIWSLLWHAEGILVTCNSGFWEAHGCNR